ncbi:MAG: HAMP domain-containing histidine kinase [Lentisphaeraceae bacterium]|nr:HAMP domain-containing histidine kinase [Lentisphaeraceae bacterium]
MSKNSAAAPTALSPEDAFQMNRIMRHKLRNHSAGLKMTLHRVQEVLEEVSSEMADRCSLMLNELEGLEHFTERMDLVFSDLPETESIMLFNLICDLRRKFATKFPLCNLVFEGKECAALFKNGNIIILALWELLANAGEAAGIDGEVTLKWELEDSVKFTVFNSGEEPPESIPLTPPMPFYTEKGRHDGLGLAIVDRICRSLGGKFQLSTESNEGVSAVVELPREEISDV